jgi:hypothetical protein
MAVLDTWTVVHTTAAKFKPLVLKQIMLYIFPVITSVLDRTENTVRLSRRAANTVVVYRVFTF